MSLFNTIEFWKTRCGEDETCGFDSLIISDLNETGTNKIIVGSFSGLLRIYEVNYNDAEQCSFKANDLLLERQLSNCIIQVVAGKLVSGSRQLHLGVIHSRSISVYNFSAILGTTEHGNQFELQIIYEHSLQHLCHQLIIGPFGGVKGRDFLCVAAVDGTLLFFEQETFIFETKLPTFLLPSPMVYVSETDLFVTLSADWCIEGYRYQDLVNTVRKKIVPNWSYNLGETIIGLQTVQNRNETFIIALSEHNLICFSGNGSVKFTKRLQFSPFTFHVYLNDVNQNVMILISSDTGTLYVYEQVTLRWSAKLSIIPICISRSNIGVDGSLVLLSDLGELICCYLGTKPSLFVAPSLENSIMNYKNVTSKLEKLHEEIKTFKINNAESLKLGVAEKEISISLKISSYDKTLNRCQVFVDLFPSRPLSNVQVKLEISLPFCVEPKFCVFSTLIEKTEFNASLQINEDREVIPTIMEITAVISFMENNVPRLILKRANILLRFILTPCAAVINEKNLFRVNIQTNKPPVIFSTLFQEFKDENWLENSCGDESAGFCLRYNEDKKCVISLSKSNYGYEFCSNSISMLYLLLKEVMLRCKTHKLGSEQESFVFDCKYVPKDELIKMVDDHVTIRNQIYSLQMSLEKLSAQYRLIQRRLLIKLKDKMPSSIDGLQTLYNDTYEKLMQTIRSIEDEQQKLTIHGYELQSTINLTFDLLLLNSSKVSSDNVNKLKNAMIITDSNSGPQGWEERTYANLTHLLRTSLVLSNKDEHRVLPAADKRVTDSSLLNKLILTAIERVAENAICTQKSDRTIKAVTPILESDELDEDRTNDVKFTFSKHEKLLTKRQTYDGSFEHDRTLAGN